MASVRVFVTGIGIVSAIGNNMEETLLAIKSQKSGIGAIRFLDTIHSNDFPSGEVHLSDLQMIEKLNLDKDVPFTRSVLMAMISAKEALLDAGIEDINKHRTGLISGTTVGGMEKSEMYYNLFLSEEAPHKFSEEHDCGRTTERIADYLGIKEFVTTISTACSSAANAIMFGVRLIKNGLLDRVVVGGTECLTKYHLNGFNTLMILDKNVCKPFDKNRKGINLGEGAAYLVIEGEHVIEQNRKKLCEITGYANSCDAFHQTATSPNGEGPYLAMKKALEVSGLNPDDIDYVNAHGTGTDNNDISEGNSIQRIFGDKIPKVSSTKSLTGHATSAAGSIEAVLCILGMQHNFVLPNLNFTEKIDELNFSPVTELLENQKLNHIMTNSFGFGGNNTSLIFSAI